MANYSFIGLDLSLSSTGCAAVSEDGHVLKTIKTNPNKFKDDLARLIHIRDAVKSFVCENSPKMICIEDVYIPPKLASSNSALKLSMLGGLVRVMLYEMGLRFCLVTPMQLKKFITGKGAGEKSLILREVFRRWTVEAADDNQADAVGLAHLARAINAQYKLDTHQVFEEVDAETEPNLISAQNEVINKVLSERPCYNF